MTNEERLAQQAGNDWQTDIDPTGDIYANRDWSGGANASQMDAEYQRLLGMGVAPNRAKRIVSVALGGMEHDWNQYKNTSNQGFMQEYGTNPSDWVNNFLWGDKQYDSACPPEAPYRASNGSGCVEKPWDTGQGGVDYNAQGGGGQGGGGGRGGGGGWKNGTAGPLPEFKYTPFEAPSYEQAMADPGYQFSVKEGLDKLQASAAARGVLRSGGTLKDIAGWSQDRAAQQYGDVYNRALQTWGAQYQGEKDKFAPQYGGWQTMYGGDLSRWTTNQNADLQKYLQREGNIFGLMNYGFPSY